MQSVGLKGYTHTLPATGRSCCLGILPACRQRLHVQLQASSGSQKLIVSETVAKQQLQQQQQQQQQQPKQPVPYSWLLPRQAVALFAAGAVLGPFCDGLHSQHNVLHYVNPSVSLQLNDLNWSFETCWWVPLLFGVAGLILGVSVPILDDLAARTAVASSDGQAAAAAQPTAESRSAADAGSEAAGSESTDSTTPVHMGQQQASWSWVMLCISLFVMQYWLSGVLEQPLLGRTLADSPVPLLDTVLFSYALMHWYCFDRTVPGFGMSAMTAVCGPVVEFGLINVFGLYHYTHPVWFGAVPSWIPWVYFCGGPAVGNLGRMVWQSLKGQYTAAQRAGAR